MLPLETASTEDILREAIKRAYEDPAWFCSEILQCPNDLWQTEVMEAVLDVDRKLKGTPTKFNHEGLCRISIRSCHGPGKTHVMAKLMHLWNFLDEGLIPCTAPKYTQVTTRLFPEFRRIRTGSLDYYKQLMHCDTGKIEWCNDPDWKAMAESSSEPENIAGLHHRRLLFLIDEGSGRRLDAMFPAIQGALSTEGAVLVVIGNPTRMTGEFYNSHNKRGTKEKYYRMHIKPSDSPRVTKQWVKDMEDMYGKHSPVYRTRVEGEFASVDESVLIHPNFVERAFDQDRDSDGSIPTLRITVDVADGGEDATEVTAALHYSSFIQILRQEQFYFETSIAPIEAAKEAIKMFDLYGGDPANGDDIVPDANGVGAGTAGYIMDKDYPCTPYKGSRQSSNPKKWRNLRVEMAIKLEQHYRMNKIFFSEACFDEGQEEIYVSHVMSIKRAEGENQDDIEPKSKIKAANLPSPDKFDSVSMQMMCKPSIELVGETTAEVIGELETANGGYDL